MKFKFLLLAVVTVFFGLCPFALSAQSGSSKSKPFRLTLTFSKFDDEFSTYRQSWPLSIPAREAVPIKASEAVYAGSPIKIKSTEKQGGLELEVFSTSGIWRSARQGFVFGGKTGDYISVPTIEGKVLVNVSITTGVGGLSSLPSICKKNGQIVKALSQEDIVGPEDVSSEGAKARIKMLGEKGVDYRIVLTNDQPCPIRYLSFIYQSVD